MDEKNVIEDTLESSISKNEILEVFLKMNAGLHSLSSMIASESGIALTDLVACEHLRIDGPLTAKDIARRVQLGSGATTAMLDRLEKRGLIKRTPHPTDRRSILVTYVPHGGPAEPQLIHFLDLLDRRLGRLGAHDRDVVRAFLKGVSNDLDHALRPGAPDAESR